MLFSLWEKIVLKLTELLNGKKKTNLRWLQQNVWDEEESVVGLLIPMCTDSASWERTASGTAEPFWTGMREKRRERSMVRRSPPSALQSTKKKNNRKKKLWKTEPCLILHRRAHTLSESRWEDVRWKTWLVWFSFWNHASRSKTLKISSHRQNCKDKNGGSGAALFSSTWD